MDEFIEEITQADGFKEALKVARLNTRGELHLAGETVIVPITRALYGHLINEATDYHFFTDRICDGIILPAYWRHEQCDVTLTIPEHSRLPPHYFKDVMTSRYCVNERGIKVTITELSAIHPINANGIEPTIANYIETAPLTTDALVLDLENNKLWGEQGKKAIFNKHIEVNNLSHLIYRAFLAKIEPRKYLEAHANRLGFNQSWTY